MRSDLKRLQRDTASGRTAAVAVTGQAGEVKSRNKKKILALVLVPLAIALVAAGWGLTRAGSAPGVQSVAGLPFVNATGSANSEFLSDRPTADVMKGLAQSTPPPVPDGRAAL